MLIVYNAHVTAAASIRLDSSHPQETRWPCAPARPKMLLRCDVRTAAVTLEDASGLLRSWQRPLEALAWLEQDALARGANARWVGYLSYDLGRLFERMPALAKDDLDLPLFVFALIQEPGSDRPLHKRDSGGGSYSPWTHNGPPALPPSTFTRDAYLGAVGRVIEYIGAGDVFQVNLSQRFTLPLNDPPASIYARLLKSAPAWYGGLLDFGDHCLICASPELFLRVTPDARSGERRVMTRPIKGTRPRRAGMAGELLSSVKDQAELNMIVDLECHDLGRVCQIGRVKVSEPRVIEAHPTVYHAAATVEGVLRKDVSFTDLLSATFPGGSVTGAPKIRAMQIIEELEPVRRGPYCGAIGYLCGDGRIEFNVAIRTMIVKDGLVHVPVGGGIVADSDPQAEYDETLTKATAMFHSLGISRGNFGETADVVYGGRPATL